MINFSVDTEVIPTGFINDTTASGTYYSHNMVVEDITYSTSNIISEAIVKMDNINSTFSSMFVGDSIRGNAAKVYVGLVNTNTRRLIGLMLIFEGEIDSYSLNEEKLRLMIGSLFSRWDKKSNSKHGTSCRWKEFKGDKCQYSGSAAQCDRSYTTCLKLGNTANFGGFRHLAGIQYKKIQWGKSYSDYDKV